jgi:hypothetical protein
MNRSTKVITLTVIGSMVIGGGAAFLFSGEPNEQYDQNGNRIHGSGGGHGFFFLPRFGGGYSGGGSGSVGTAPSARGGFGSTGVSGSSSS